MKAKYPNLESANPSQCIASKMMKCNRILSQVFRKHLLNFGLTNSQMTILFIIAKKGDVTQAQLASMLYLEKSTVSRNMRRLFEKELIIKEKNQIINITEKGKSFLEKIIPQWDKAMEESRKLLANDGLEALDTVLSKLKS